VAAGRDGRHQTIALIKAVGPGPLAKHPSAVVDSLPTTDMEDLSILLKWVFLFAQWEA
jgi:hypothetical protein